MNIIMKTVVPPSIAEVLPLTINITIFVITNTIVLIPANNVIDMLIYAIVKTTVAIGII